MILANIYLDKETNLYKSLLQKKLLLNNCFQIHLGLKPSIGETLSLNVHNTSDENLIKFLSHRETLFFRIDDLIQSFFIINENTKISILGLKCTVIEKPF